MIRKRGDARRDAGPGDRCVAAVAAFGDQPMPDDARLKLERLWREHLERPFPSEWGELEEVFGWVSDRPEVQDLEGADALRKAWGEPDLALYDTYIAGHVWTILTGKKSGAEVLSDADTDARLLRYLDICEAEAADDAMRTKIRACRTYFEHVNEMLELARAIPRHTPGPR
jgi:hypothetical protein